MCTLQNELKSALQVTIMSSADDPDQVNSSQTRPHFGKSNPPQPSVLAKVYRQANGFRDGRHHSQNFTIYMFVLTTLLIDKEQPVTAVCSLVSERLPQMFCKVPFRFPTTALSPPLLRKLLDVRALLVFTGDTNAVTLFEIILCCNCAGQLVLRLSSHRSIVKSTNLSHSMIGPVSIL